MRYELFYLVGSTKETELEKIKKEVCEIVEKDGGVFEEKETIEKRKMSYEIKHETHGIYVAQRFEIESEKIDEIIKKLNLNSSVLRFVISRADELPELKTKEERLEEAKKKTTAKPAEVKKVAPSATSPATSSSDRRKTERKEEKKPEEKETQEDIDKKLEEILNI